MAGAAVVLVKVSKNRARLFSTERSMSRVMSMPPRSTACVDEYDA